MSSVSRKSKLILRSNLVLSVLVMAGCMKPLTNGQTVIDPSHDGSPDPTEVYNPDVLKPDFRENMSPKLELDSSEMLPGRRNQPTTPAKVKVLGDQPDEMMEDAPLPGETTRVGSVTTPADGGTTSTTPKVDGTTTVTPAETAPDVRRRFNPIPKPRETEARPGVTAATGATSPGVVAATGARKVTAPTGVQKVTAPTGVQKVTAPTGAQKVTAPTGAQKVTAPTGVPKVTAPTGAQKVTAPTGVTASTSTDVSGRRRFRPIPRPTDTAVTAPTGKQTAVAPTGKQTVTAPSGKVEMKPIPKPKPVVTTPTEREAKPVTTTPQETRTTPATDGYSVRVADNRDINETGTITPTVYFVAVIDEDKESCDDKVGMYLTSGTVSMRVCRRTASFCSEQGSCLIKKGGKWQTFNVVRRVNGIDRYVLINDGCSYGYGVRNICLDPYYSLAADLSVYDPGDVIFIPKLRGLKLPNGARHDGYFIVRDKGRGVKGRGRFDFFSGSKNWGDGSNPFVKMRLNDKDTDMTYHKVAGDLAARVKAKRGYPKLPARGTVHSALNEANTKGVPTSHLAQPGAEVQAGHGFEETPSYQ
ncbi:MAG: hypothetical protein KF767_10640 [Bdellovibrionaceae bacterium]|nr:hypothetical protein [Pseudobdellovibrionaceae bacterium]